ncbi:MAG: 6-carboxytetrahydropterin synthase [Spirochaetales bacterium]|nr:6-carboxytetrahydropterin synthase [Spirochaetales bacterium]
MYAVGVTGDFTAIHSMVGDVPPEEKEPHPHGYRLEWTLWVEKLDERGFSLDISVLERIRDELFSDMAGKVLNDISWFKEKTTSLEYLCGYVFESLQSAVNGAMEKSDTGRISRMEVRIWENEHAWAGVDGGFSTVRSR